MLAVVGSLGVPNRIVLVVNGEEHNVVEGRLFGVVGWVAGLFGGFGGD